MRTCPIGSLASDKSLICYVRPAMGGKAPSFPHSPLYWTLDSTATSGRRQHIDIGQLCCFIPIKKDRSSKMFKIMIFKIEAL